MPSNGSDQNRGFKSFEDLECDNIPKRERCNNASGYSEKQVVDSKNPSISIRDNGRTLVLGAKVVPENKRSIAHVASPKNQDDTSSDSPVSLDIEKIDMLLDSATESSSENTIKKGAFFGRKDLTSIVIPKGMKTGKRAFYNGYNVKSIPEKKKISDSIDRTNITPKTKSLKKNPNAVDKEAAPVVPVGTKTIGKNAFAWRSNLTSAVIPEGVTRIGESAFRGCGKLTAVVIPKSVKIIGANAFRSCPQLSSVIIPEGSELTKIGRNAFHFCTKLASPITIPEGVTKIETETFWGCEKLPSVVIPKSVKEIGTNAFRSCSQLSSVIIPKGSELTKIGRNAFYFCMRLSAINIPNNVTIANNAFRGCACKVR